MSGDLLALCDVTSSGDEREKAVRHDLSIDFSTSLGVRKRVERTRYDRAFCVQILSPAHTHLVLFCVAGCMRLCSSSVFILV